MKPMTYRGYSAQLTYSDEDGCFVGRVVGIADLITFHGEHVKELRSAFEDSIDFYLQTCAERNEIPNKAYSGKLLLRLPPATHAAVAVSAEMSGKSVNQWVTDILSQASQPK